MTARVPQVLPWGYGEDRDARAVRTPFISAVTRPLDALRRPLWAFSARFAWGRACIRDRGLRLTVLALAHMTIATSFTLLTPAWLLLLGPLLLGVPHLVNDVRYLLLKPPLPLRRGAVALVLTPLAAMTALRVLATVGVTRFSASLEVALGCLGFALAAWMTRTPLTRRLVAVAVIGVLAVAVSGVASWTLLVLAHVHNLVAFGLWLWIARGLLSARKMLLISIAYGAIFLALLAGVGDGLLQEAASAGSIGRFSLEGLARTLAPGTDPVWALRWLATFAFAQSIHYAIWIRLIPQRMDKRPPPPTFERSLGRVRHEFGRWGFSAVVAACLAIPLLALLIGAEEARHVYLLVALAHGWVELAIVAALVTYGRGRVRA